jgi:hypothetical protein
MTAIYPMDKLLSANAAGTVANQAAEVASTMHRGLCL